jgi:hypothetical protein
MKSIANTSLITGIKCRFYIVQDCVQSRSQSMPVRGLGSVMPLPNPRTGILWERDWIVLGFIFMFSVELLFSKRQ